MIELRNVTKKFDKVVPLKDVSVTINKGDVIAVIGPSGTGKSTLIRCINMLTPPTSGQIFIDGEEITSKNADVKKLRRKCGMVFQQFNLFNHLTVLENVCEPQIHILKRTPQEACDNAMKYLRKVGMEDKIYDYPDQLSGGQKQRVAIARTLANDPEYILLDEPTSALDPAMVGDVERIIKQLADEGRTMIIITHEMEFAKHVANRVFYMDQGSIYEDGTVEQIFEHPEKELTRRFIRQLSALDLAVRKKDADFISTLDELHRFFDKCMVVRRKAYRIELMTEELLFNTILPLMRDEDEVLVEFENVRYDENVTLTITGNVITADILDHTDEVSRGLIKHSADSLDIQDGRICAVF